MTENSFKTAKQTMSIVAMVGVPGRNYGTTAKPRQLERKSVVDDDVLATDMA